MKFAAAPLLLFAISSAASAGAPELYRQGAYQSPVRAAPDDLLFLPGMGFSADDKVIYEAVSDTRQPPAPPQSLPLHNDAVQGLLTVVSAADVPYSLTLRLPAAMQARRSYALRVVTAGGEWSQPLLINDARPLWLTPTFGYATAAVDGLDRYLKIVGRNLDAATGSITRVRLRGPEVVELPALAAATGKSALNHFVARVLLPARMAAGGYDVEVSRDAHSWTRLEGQRWQVRPDPRATPQFALDTPAFGHCQPDTGQDATPCLQLAIAAAAKAGGGVVVVGPGEWQLKVGSAAGPATLLIPAGVSIRGSAASAGALAVAGASAGEPASVLVTDQTLILAGHNVISDLTFRNPHHYQPSDAVTPALRLGSPYGHDAVEDITITRNVFDRPQTAIADSMAPLRRLIITHNVFGAYAAALELSGDRQRFDTPYRLDDLIITQNRFSPGSFLDVAGRSGAIASELGAGYRVDFSDNIADGADARFLYSNEDAHGWRAAFFWNMNGNQEQVLISGNTATCTGDKIGDGEAIGLDINGNTFGLDRARVALESDLRSVTVAGPLQPKQWGASVPQTYYLGHWVQLVGGPGIGQARRIRAYRQDTSGTVHLEVEPAWDVMPQPGKTQLVIGREFWQTYVVANDVDNRKPLCRKSNRSDRKAGVIGLWAQAADTVIEGNVQHDSDGILYQQLYSAAHACPECESRTHVLSNVEIRGNLIDGEYDWEDACSSSGIVGSLGASPGAATPPPTVSRGLTISHNRIVHADAERGGAIALTPSWYRGPDPGRWPLVSNLLLYHNDISGIEEPLARACGTASAPGRVGISLGGAGLVRNTVLYANHCSNVQRGLWTDTENPIRLCPSGAAASCECAAVPLK